MPATRENVCPGPGPGTRNGSPITGRGLRVALCCVAAFSGWTSVLGAQGAAGHATPVPHVQAARLDGSVLVDGRLDEATWSTAPAATTFTQFDPDEGQPSTQRTEVRFAVGTDALYVGARMYDSLGAAGVRTRLARRDQDIEGDYLMLVFDTFHDHSGRTLFRINPSGVKYDAGQANPYVDPSWDPVWDAATAVDSLGWTAEMRIPLSQLRFPRDSVQTWGMQVWRYVERLSETSMWSPWGRDDLAGPARFGHLTDVRIGARPRGLEFLPYTVMRASHVTPAQRGSPFQDGSAYTVRAGADVKALLGSSLTVAATLNPDFGQVEVDPAVVNLSAFETFFQEKRPFFVEGSGLFSFGGLNCFTCSNAHGMSLFYSRRIGRRPQGSLPGDPLYWDVPENSAIWGAAKVTLQSRNGWQVGVLDAVTGSEEASLVYRGDARLSREVEPLTNYLVGRAKRTLRGGNVVLGAMATSVGRRFEYDSLARELPRHSEAVGVDWNVSWQQRTFNLSGNLAVAQTSGDSAAIRRLQLSSARYFQRPDREYDDNGFFTDGYDPTLGSLRGYGGYLRLAKVAGLWRGEGQVNFRSPGFETNDAAFLALADYVWLAGNVQRRWTRPNQVYRSVQLTGGGQRQYNYGGDLTDAQVHGSASSQLANYWEASVYTHFRPAVDADRLTRGGPVVRRPEQRYVSVQLRTDSRRALVLAVNPTAEWSDGATSLSLGSEVRMKPAPNVSISFGPSFSHNESTTQYVARFSDPAATHFTGRRVVFADLVQNTLALDTRFSLTFTRDLTLELFAQPFVSAGEYSDYKEYERPRTPRRVAFDGSQLRAVRDAAGRDSVYVLDPDRDPATPGFSFDNPDFNVRSLRGNAVMRWEWRPGSTLFFVWQQNRSAGEQAGDFDVARDTGRIFQASPDNVFVVKATYWFGR